MRRNARQVLQPPAHHARDGGNRFQHDRAMAVPAGEERVGEQSAAAS